MKISNIFFSAGVVLGVIGFVFFVHVNFISKSDSPAGLYVSAVALSLMAAGILLEIFQNRL